MVERTALGDLEQESEVCLVSQIPLMGLWFGLLIVSQSHHDVRGADLAFFGGGVWGRGGVLLEENGCSLSAALLCPGNPPPLVDKEA